MNELIFNINQYKLITYIDEWEAMAGESFVDYFANDAINTEDWINFLYKKLFIARADYLLKVYTTKRYVDQSEIFEISFGLDDDKSFDKQWDVYNIINMKYLSEYILKNSQILQWFIEFTQQEDNSELTFELTNDI